MKHLKKELFLFIEEGINEVKKTKNKKALALQIPNILTFSRLLLLPFILVNFYNGNLIIAGILTIISVFTDFFDGLIARKLKAITPFGAKFDAISDKLFSTTVMLALVIVNKYIIIPILLEVVIGSINAYFSKKRKVKTSIIGKIKTFFLDSLMCSLFFTNYNIDILINSLFYITIIGQVITALDYTIGYKKSS